MNDNPYLNDYLDIFNETLEVEPSEASDKEPAAKPNKKYKILVLISDSVD